MRIPGLFNPLGAVRAIGANRFLVSQLVRREVESQFRGSFLGWLWLFARPLLQLSVYTFVFGVLWRRDALGEPMGSFALQLFCGLSIYNLFAQVVSKSAQCVSGKAGFVKQLVFPLEILPWVQLLAALVLSLPWFVLLFGGLLLVHGTVPWTAILFPLWLIPLALFAGGFAWFFASLGVYIRDLRQLMPVLLQMIFFTSPVFWQEAVSPMRVLERGYVLVTDENGVVSRAGMATNDMTLHFADGRVKVRPLRGEEDSCGCKEKAHL